MDTALNERAARKVALLFFSSYSWLYILVPAACLAQEPVVRTIIPVTAPFSKIYGLPAATAQEVYLTGDSGIEARTIADGRLLWRAPLTKNVPSGAVLAGDRILIAEQDIYALDRISGKRLWRYQAEADTSLALPVVAQNQVYVGDAKHTVYALATSDGNLLWKVDVAPDNPARGVVVGLAVDLARDDARVYVSVERWLDGEGQRSEGALLALDVRTGAVLWRYTTANEKGIGLHSGMSSAPMVSGSSVLVGDYVGNAVRSISSRGMLEWVYRGERGYGGPRTSPFVREGVVYFGSGDLHFRALRHTDGTLLWDTPFAGSIGDFAPCGSRALVVHGSMESVDLATGARGRHSVVASPDIVTSNVASDGTRAIAFGPAGMYIIGCTQMKSDRQVYSWRVPPS